MSAASEGVSIAGALDLRTCFPRYCSDVSACFAGAKDSELHSNNVSSPEA